MPIDHRPFWDRKQSPPKPQPQEYYELFGAETIGGVDASHGIELITAAQANTLNLELWGVGDRRRWRKVSGAVTSSIATPAV